MNKNKLNLVRPTPEEESAIAAQLAEDPDTYEWTDEDWANAQTTQELFPETHEWALRQKKALEAWSHPAGNGHPGQGDDSLVQGPDGRGWEDRRDAVAGAGRTDPQGPCPVPRRPQARGLSAEAPGVVRCYLLSTPT